MKPIIYPYKIGSRGAKALANELNTIQVYPDRKYRYKPNHLIINWGNSQNPLTWKSPVEHFLNPTPAVTIASNKLKTFQNLLGEVNIPTWTQDKEKAKTFFQNTRRVYCRKSLTGHSGYGIIIANNPNELVDAPLYVTGVDGYRDEYRVHVFMDNIIDIQQKKLRANTEKHNTEIRNFHNGYIYAREGITLSTNVKDMCIQATKTLGLDFGAVDIIVKRDEPQNCYILEINTAPGLEGTTLQNYVNAIKELL